MRARTLILIILVLVVGIATAVLVIDRMSDGGILEGILPGRAEVVTAPEEPVEGAPEPGLPAPSATRALSLATVLVARVDLPIGERIRDNLIDVEMRPSDNIALQGNYTFSDPNELVGQITVVPISKGQEILRPMVTSDPTAIAASGSDLALFVDVGRVAVAFPIDKFAGVAYSLRPGDMVDAMMTLRVVEIDPEFNTALPNATERVIETELIAGRAFLFPPSTQGRLEFVTEINQVVEIVPSDIFIEGQDFEAGTPIPKRVTQLTIQQAEVLWVGTWRDPREFEKAAREEQALAEAAAAEGGAVAEGAEGAGLEPTPVSGRSENKPDVIILSMLGQDALALKWALERGIDIDLALRAQGDRTVFVTTGVSLPEIISQGGLAIPEPADFDLHPRIEDVTIPNLPPNPPIN
jgi:Flp pilus assembly protein CpaB